MRWILLITGSWLKVKKVWWNIRFIRSISSNTRRKIEKESSSEYTWLIYSRTQVNLCFIEKKPFPTTINTNLKLLKDYTTYYPVHMPKLMAMFRWYRYLSLQYNQKCRQDAQAFRSQAYQKPFHRTLPLWWFQADQNRLLVRGLSQIHCSLRLTWLSYEDVHNLMSWCKLADYSLKLRRTNHWRTLSVKLTEYLNC